MNKIPESDCFMDALAQTLVWSSAQITPVVQLVNPHMENVNDKCRLERMLK